MHIMWFTERQFHYDPETEPARSALLESQILRNRSFFGLPNANFDQQQGSMLLNECLEEKIYSEDLGFDGLMLNEHHGTPFCLGSVMDVEAAILAKATKRAKIVLLGNPVPTVANALRLAEELSMIDLISKGRLVPGWVRGADRRNVEQVHRRGGARGVSGRAGKLRISAAGLRQRKSATRGGTWKAISLRRCLRTLRAARMDVPARIQLERSDPPAGAAAA